MSPTSTPSPSLWRPGGTGSALTQVSKSASSGRAIPNFAWTASAPSPWLSSPPSPGCRECTCFSLQKGPGAEQLAALHRPLPGDRFGQSAWMISMEPATPRGPEEPRSGHQRGYGDCAPGWGAGDTGLGGPALRPGLALADGSGGQSRGIPPCGCSARTGRRLGRGVCRDPGGHREDGRREAQAGDGRRRRPGPEGRGHRRAVPARRPRRLGWFPTPRARRQPAAAGPRTCAGQALPLRPDGVSCDRPIRRPVAGPVRRVLRRRGRTLPAGHPAGLDRGGDRRRYRRAIRCFWRRRQGRSGAYWRSSRSG